MSRFAEHHEAQAKGCEATAAVLERLEQERAAKHERERAAFHREAAAAIREAGAAMQAMCDGIAACYDVKTPIATIAENCRAALARLRGTP